MFRCSGGNFVGYYLYFIMSGKVIPVLNCVIKHYAMKTYGKWRYSSIILNLGTRWRWVVSLTPLPLYPRGWGPRYSLDRRLDEPQSWSGLYGEEKNILPLLISNPGCPDHNLVFISTELFRFLCTMWDSAKVLVKATPALGVCELMALSSLG
jgi:hypothetical protein